MAKYRKKPVVIEAVEWTGNEKEIVSFMRKLVGEKPEETKFGFNNNNEILIETLEGTMKADIGDYIIKGVNGEFYPCKPDIFHKTYEKVE